MFDSFCKENDIKYFLSNGTLLGAVKYKGFIPWDDDIDVFVPREDYNRLIALFKDDEKYCLFAFEKNSKFLYPFAKLCDMKTRKEENNTKSGVVLGIDIDIFPLDAWKSDLSEAKREFKLIRKKIGHLMLSKKYKPDSKTAIRKLVKGFKMIFCKLCGSEYFIKKS